MIRIPFKRRNIWFWPAIIGIFFVFLYIIKSILLPFVLGMATAYFLDPAANKLQKAGLSRNLATILITVLFFLLIILLLAIIAPLMISQVSSMMNSIPDYLAQAEKGFIPLMENKLQNISPSFAQEIKNSISSSAGIVAREIGEFLANILTSGIAFINIISLLLITPVVAFYLLRDWEKIVVQIDGLLPRSHAETIRQQLRMVDATLAGFVRGQLNVCLLLAAYYAIGLSLVGLDFGFAIGLITGLLVVFPYIGLLVGAGSGLLIACFQFSDIWNVILVLAVFASGQIIEGNFVTPKLVGEKVGLHPLWIIFAMLAGAALFGLVGIFISVPVAAVVGVIVRFAIGEYQKSSYFK